MIQTSLSRMVIGALAISALATGCATEVGEPATQVATDATTAALVGEVQLSPTHTVRFWDHGNGLGQIQEGFHADLDRDAALTLNKVDLDGRPLADVYEIFAGAKADANVLQKLRAIDRLHLQRLLAEPPPGAIETPADLPQVLGAAQSPLPPEQRASVATSTAPAEIEARQGAEACTEPNWNWAGDASWFAANFCTTQNGVPNWSCRTNQQGWISWGWFGWLSFFKATVFNQSFCTTALWILKWRSHSLGGSLEGTPVNTRFTTRWVESSAWNATGQTEFFTKVTPENPGVQRIGLAIHQVVR